MQRLVPIYSVGVSAGNVVYQSVPNQMPIAMTVIHVSSNGRAVMIMLRVMCLLKREVQYSSRIGRRLIV